MKKMNKTTKSNLITYGIVIIAYIVVQILLKAGVMSSLMQGLLVPLCIYVVLAVSLNLVVGISGELSLGHAGFMCVGAFGGAFLSNCLKDVITVSSVRLLLAMLAGAALAAVFGLLIGIPVLRLQFLLSNSLAEDTGYRRRSGWVSYPMVTLNLPELYRLDPPAFGRMLNVR